MAVEVAFFSAELHAKIPDLTEAYSAAGAATCANIFLKSRSLTEMNARLWREYGDCKLVGVMAPNGTDIIVTLDEQGHVVQKPHDPKHSTLQQVIKAGRELSAAHEKVTDRDRKLLNKTLVLNSHGISARARLAAA
ncbi:MAG: hypothetical protein WAO98_06480 [Alphaproteobacteria bacterium]